MNPFFRRSCLLVTLSMLLVFAVACGTEETSENVSSESENGNAENGTANEVNEDAEANDQASAELEGSVVIDGSGTVYPFMAKAAEDYMTEEAENVSVEVSRSGTSAGFEKFLTEGGTDFNDASREIKDEETEKAEELGMEVKEFQVALDGLTFVINKENDWATELTQEEIIDVFLASGDKQNWSDVRPEFPDEEINTYGPNENHGTYEFMFETILEEQDLVEGINLQQEYSTLVDMVSKDENAIAFFGYGYYVNNQDQLTAVNVDFGDGPVEPTLDTIEIEGDYGPFTRPVFTYLNVDHAQEKPQVLDFAIYVMENAAETAAETGFAPLPEDQLQEAVDDLEGLQ